MKQFVPCLTGPWLCLCLLMTTRAALAQTSTGPVGAANAASITVTGSTFGWTNPAGAMTTGGGSATAAALATSLTGNTADLELTNFGFSIPFGATITGITASITRSASGLSLTVAGIPITGSVRDNTVQLIGAGVPTSNYASGAAWGSSAATVSYGGPLDDWGVTGWTPAMINSPGFGLSLSVDLAGSSLLGINLLPGAAVDVVSLDVTYLPLISLAINLEQWTVTRQQSGNTLRWTAAVTDLPGAFIVERSPEGTTWQDLATIAAPVNQSAYSYTDSEPLRNGPGYYRLRLHTTGQADTWSSVQVIAAPPSLQSMPSVSVYPNPFHDMINITGSQAFSMVSLKDIQGRTLWTQEYGSSSGGSVTTARIPASNLPAGLYFVQIDGAAYKLIKN
jgi:Secretion system C-terminal sorting domain